MVYFKLVPVASFRYKCKVKMGFLKCTKDALVMICYDSKAKLKITFSRVINI